jgi:hypothetical protein
LNHSTPEEIWNGKNMQAVRRSIGNNKVDIACHRAPCKFVNGKSADMSPRYFLFVLGRIRSDPLKAIRRLAARLKLISIQPKWNSG